MCIGNYFHRPPLSAIILRGIYPERLIPPILFFIAFTINAYCFHSASIIAGCLRIFRVHLKRSACACALHLSQIYIVFRSIIYGYLWDELNWCAVAHSGRRKGAHIQIYKSKMLQSTAKFRFSIELERNYQAKTVAEIYGQNNGWPREEQKSETGDKQMGRRRETHCARRM